MPFRDFIEGLKNNVFQNIFEFRRVSDQEILVPDILTFFCTISKSVEYCVKNCRERAHPQLAFGAGKSFGDKKKTL